MQEAGHSKGKDTPPAIVVTPVSIRDRLAELYETIILLNPDGSPQSSSSAPELLTHGRVAAVCWERQAHFGRLVHGCIEADVRKHTHAHFQAFQFFRGLQDLKTFASLLARNFAKL